jgi:hypothetical protein
MPRTAETDAFDNPLLAAVPRALRAVPAQDGEGASLHDAVIRRLAGDRLRDLRDDGLTTAYMASMYGVDAQEMEQLAGELLPSRR